MSAVILPADLEQIAVLRGVRPPTDGIPKELRQWAWRQADRGRSEQSIAQELGWAVCDVRRAVAARAGLSAQSAALPAQMVKQ
jgi:hypothetical protein